MGFPQGGNIIDIHLALSLDIHLVRRELATGEEKLRGDLAIGVVCGVIGAGRAVEVVEAIGVLRVDGGRAIAIQWVGVSGGGGKRVRKTRGRRGDVGLDSMCGLLSKLLALDDVLDVFLVLATEVVVPPPHWSLVFAAETEILASSAHRRAFVALLASQSAGVAS